ncbi:hypothetical protein [Kribbella antibiotica]|nr:hypothetical protein [Kribbella antibiotica]
MSGASYGLESGPLPGVGMVIYAQSIGPLLQIFLPWFTVRLKTD